MNYLLSKLSGGDLRSDGQADEVIKTILKGPELLTLLTEGLTEPDVVVRARVAHSFETISRSHPELIKDLVPTFIDHALHDEVPMVRWHMAMIFGNLTYSGDEIKEILSVLFKMLTDKSTFVRAWSIVSLCQLGILYKDEKEDIVRKIRFMENESKKAVQVRAQKTVAIIQGEEIIPSNWIKRRHR